jgi:hypothetical protein
MIEILVVMIIIGILSVIIFVSLGNQRQRARVTKAISSVKSAMPITITCISFDGEVLLPDELGGNPICSGSPETPEGSNWPVLSSDCKYCGFSSSGLFVRFTCAEDCDEDNDSTCNIQDGKCEYKN